MECAAGSTSRRASWSHRTCFLDEPTTGLDPRSRGEVWDIVRALVREGTTVLLTTQYLDEADQLADRIAVIDRGAVIAEGTRGDLKASTGAAVLRVRLHPPGSRPEADRVLSRVLGVGMHAEPDPAVLSARLPAGPLGARVATALAELSRREIGVVDLALGPPGLDEVFLALTGRTTTTEHIEESLA